MNRNDTTLKLSTKEFDLLAFWLNVKTKPFLEMN